ncbi:MAG: class I SAM-dependent methyltransferase [Bdellovibrionales bacterium]|nr:class I SAM-dependent methyltransferase [Bdellovibrionales bacterium]
MQTYKNRIEDTSLQLINYARVALYTVESFPILAIKKLLKANAPMDPMPPENHQKLLKQTLDGLIEQDIVNVRQGLYPRELLYPEKPQKHICRYKELLIDALKATLRQKNKKHKEFSEHTEPLLKDMPEYYKRNFHYQTDGYLSSKSAELYSHQTEILFKGTIALMRRVLMAELIRHIQARKTPVRILEIGGGAGEATEILLKSCPNIEVVFVEPSKPYMEFAKNKLSEFNNIEYVNDFFENYQSRKKFDVVFSSFLFHELPLEVRRTVFSKSSKLLKKNAISFHIDSLQLNDNQEFNWALIQFPKDFHEPFYANYIKTPLEELISNDLSFNSNQQAFLSKSVMALNL